MISSMSVWIVIMIMHFYVRPYRSKFMDRLDDILLVFMLCIFIACAHFKLEQDKDSAGMNQSDIDRFSFFVLGTMGVSALCLAFFVGREVRQHQKHFSYIPALVVMFASGAQWNLHAEIAKQC
jgi:NADH:ubiquinone oxidoreductase subunit 2 (subunit N)